MKSNSKKIEEPFEDILYEIGLYLSSVGVRPKRRLHNNPLLIFTIITLFMIGRTLSIITPEEDDQTLLFIGDVGHYFGLKLQFSFHNRLNSVPIL